MPLEFGVTRPTTYRHLDRLDQLDENAAQRLAPVAGLTDLSRHALPVGVGSYSARVTATYAYDEQPAGGHPLLPGASPAAIREHLLSSDREQFDAAYEAALAESRRSLDLTELFKTLEQWRRTAALQSDPQAYRQAVRRAAQLLTGQASTPDEPLDVTRAKAGM